ncbi:hypothetical protein GCM10010517_22990 [Streptosporangium fragile]|uniref:Uncharacterized protein n=1 Tax=Streptosporangium fragile TaxID=46186 RepID=A0ABP6IDW2_9ACTN
MSAAPRTTAGTAAFTPGRIRLTAVATATPAAVATSPGTSVPNPAARPRSPVAGVPARGAGTPMPDAGCPVRGACARRLGRLRRTGVVRMRAERPDERGDGRKVMIRVSERAGAYGSRRLPGRS